MYWCHGGECHPIKSGTDIRDKGNGGLPAPSAAADSSVSQSAGVFHHGSRADRERKRGHSVRNPIRTVLSADLVVPYLSVHGPASEGEETVAA